MHQTCCVAQDDPECLILLPPSPQCLDHGQMPLQPTSYFFFLKFELGLSLVRDCQKLWVARKPKTCEWKGEEYSGELPCGCLRTQPRSSVSSISPAQFEGLISGYWHEPPFLSNTLEEAILLPTELCQRAVEITKQTQQFLSGLGRIPLTCLFLGWDPLNRLL